MMTLSLGYFSFYWYVGETTLLWSFILWSIIVTAAHLHLIYYYKKSYPEQKKQFFILIVAIIGYFGGASNFLLLFEIDVYPLGNFLIPIHSFCVTYAILKHQLLGINVAIKKGVIYSTLLLLLSLFYLTLVLISERFIQGFFGYQSTLLSIISAFFIGILFFSFTE